MHEIMLLDCFTKVQIRTWLYVGNNFDRLLHPGENAENSWPAIRANDTE